MFGDSDERTPLLQEQSPGQFFASSANRDGENLSDAYSQFCLLIGNAPVDQSSSRNTPSRDTLYYRALQHRRRQAWIYALTRALTNTLLLSQVVLGAALTGLGATNSPGWLITVFGAANTVIAGLVAFLKSRGQPMRARMFRDDLDRVVDEIENSATMWRGISQRVHGYDAIDTDEAVTVRSEVARLTRLYDKAVKTNTMNDPDHYGSGISVDNAQRGLRARTNQPFQTTQPQPPTLGETPLVPAPAPIALSGPSADPDESPATHLPVSPPSKAADLAKSSPPVPAETSNGVPIAADAVFPAPAPGTSASGADESTAPTVAPGMTGNPDLDASPATSADVPRAKEKSQNQLGSDTATAGAPQST